MNTIIKDWQIVSVTEEDELIGHVLWGVVVDDMSYRFAKNDYVCTSNIVRINFYTQLITTATKSLYQILGEGSVSEIDIDDFELLRNGFSPQYIHQLKLASTGYVH